MTTRTSYRAAPQGFVREHHAVAGLFVTFVLVVSMALVGSLVRATSSPPWSTHTPGHVRLPTPSPLPPVAVPLEHPAEKGDVR